MRAAAESNTQALLEGTNDPKDGTKVRTDKVGHAGVAVLVSHLVQVPQLLEVELRQTKHT